VIARSQSLQRQVALAVLAASDLDQIPPAFSAHDIFRFVRQMKPRDALQSVLGSVPDGFLGALRKVAPEDQKRDFYLRLHQLFADPRRRQQARVAAQLTQISGDKLDVIESLDPILLTPGWVEKLDRRRDAETLSAAVAAIQLYATSATAAALRASAVHCGPATGAVDFVARWLVRIDRLPAPPVELGAEFLPIRTGQDMARLARRFHNCLGAPAQLLRTLCGRSYHWLVRPHQVIVTLRRVGFEPGPSAWILETMLRANNRNPSWTVRQQICDELGRRGIGRFDDHAPEPKPIAALRRAVRVLDHGLFDLHPLDEGVMVGRDDDEDICLLAAQGRASGA
jgi:hypothetical protein